ncbi:polyisoprenoid-binding protein YceI [Spinactinospora alkalitolerans]|uniref:Polyisoprenoid-binding protein YceI n=1 Tax=Spinactinospora alkalitolerans TaxID=687207 RepID=A0A852TTE4_9ACTN|nr:YceI family protein [Spinactinospora alkalitolerans]NYE45210.1 polyisoprenoid-binding protein YceI [Spinactinospora alkalitolerans]
MNPPQDSDAIGPTPGTWHLDPLHSSLIFVARYLRFGRVQGTFGRAKGLVMVADNPLHSKVDVALEAASVNTGVEARDNHLRSADFLDVENHPELRFVSTGLERSDRGNGVFLMYGDMTIHGTTRPMRLECHWVGESPDYASPDEIYGHFFAAHTRIRLSDFGVGDGGPTAWGERLVGDTVDVVLEIRLQDRDPIDFLRQIGHE